MSARHRRRRDTPSWRQARRALEETPRPSRRFTVMVGSLFVAGALGLGISIAPPDDEAVVLTSSTTCGVAR